MNGIQLGGSDVRRANSKNGEKMRQRGSDHFLLCACAVLIATGFSTRLNTEPVQAANRQGQLVPSFEVDPTWPRLPENLVLGQVASVAVDSRDHVWVLHRPLTVGEDLTGQAAPPVLEFDSLGNFVRAWGGAGANYEWPGNEHGIHVDSSGHVWVGGNGGGAESDDMLLKFTREGEFVLQVGRRGQSSGNQDTSNLRRPAESYVFEDSNEIFVADGYGNRRVIVLDAETGEFKRMWGAFGNEPEDQSASDESESLTVSQGVIGPDDRSGPPQFGTVHGIEVSDDGLVYVADRNNSRIQVFDGDGVFRGQAFVNVNAESALTVAGLAFSSDVEQKFIYVADQGNSHIHIVDRETLVVVDSFGTSGELPGAFRALHHIASDSHGNLYTAEAQRGRRAQKFALTGMVSRQP